MKRWLLAGLAVLAVILQVSLVPALRPLGVVPNLMLVLVTLVGLEGTASVALTVAVAGGLVLDLTSGANLGLWTGGLVLAALVTGMVHRGGIEVHTWLVPGVIVAGGTVLMSLIILAGLVTIASAWPVDMLTGRLVIELVLNLVLIGLLRPVVRRLMPAASADAVRAGRG